ncbi:MAG: porin family protein [Balneolaceae bacterium]|nr:porin family protein [Balneolaceae bacterium]
MNKILLSAILTAFVLIFTANIHAQDRHFGIKGGGAAYQMTSEFGGVSSTSEPKVGFAAGIYGDFPINRILSIQPEVVFVQKGGEESNSSVGTSSITLNYVDVPLLLKINAPLEGNFKPYIFGGPYAGYLVDASSEADGNSVDINELLEELHYGLKVGVGIRLGNIVVDARYDMGYADIYAEDVDFGGGDADVKLLTEGIIISVGIAF